MKIPIQIKHLDPTLQPKVTNSFIFGCNEEEQKLLLGTEELGDLSYMSFEDFNKFYLSNSNLKLGHEKA